MSGPTLKLGDEHAAELRGIDLGDDRAQLDRCEQLLAEGKLTAYGSLVTGVLHYRAKRWTEALEALEVAAEDEEQRQNALLLAAYAQLRQGAGEEALRTLDLASRSGAGASGTAWRIHHARGDALFGLGRHAEAEGEYAAAIELEKRSLTLVELGLSRSGCGAGDSAIEALEAAIEDHRDADAVYELAALKAERGDTARALSLLRDHADFKTVAARAASDSRFARAASDAEFAAFISEKEPDLGWLSRFPIVAKLAAESTLAALGVRFVGEAESDERTLSARNASPGLEVLWTNALLEDSRARAEQSVLVALGPSLPSRQAFLEHEIELWVDLDEPERLYLATGVLVPAAFWLPLPATVEGNRTAVAEFHPPLRRRHVELPRVERAFMGYPESIKVPNPYSGELEDECGFHELDRHFTMSAFADGFLWGTIHDEDPWPDVFPAQPGYMAKIVTYSRAVRKQTEGGICRFTQRTRFSRSQVSIELHHGKVFVWEARYRPSSHATWTRAFNERHGTSYAEDMPFDVIGMLFGFDALTAGTLESSLAEQTSAGGIVGYLEAITAVRHSDVGVTSLVWQHMQSEDENIRRALAQLCVTFNWEFLLEDLALVEPSLEFRMLIGRVLDAGIQPLRFDDMGEPVTTASGGEAAPEGEEGAGDE